MPIFVAALLGGLAQAASSLVGRVLLALGIGFVAFEGIDLALDAMKSSVVTNLTGLPLKTAMVVGMLKVDVAVNILFSAIAARWVLSGITGGVIKKMVTR